MSSPPIFQNRVLQKFIQANIFSLDSHSERLQVFGSKAQPSYHLTKDYDLAVASALNLA